MEQIIFGAEEFVFGVPPYLHNVMLLSVDYLRSLTDLNYSLIVPFLFSIHPEQTTVTIMQ